MQQRFSRGWLIICILVSINAHALKVGQGLETFDIPLDGDYDFEDFSPGKYVDGSIESVENNDDTKSSTTARSKYTKLPLVHEPDAEMLPAHYTGVKPPGVDHMEITHLDSETLGSNQKNSLADGTISGGFKKFGTSITSVGKVSHGVKNEKGAQRNATFEKSQKGETGKENKKGEYAETAGKKKSQQEKEKHFKGRKDESSGAKSENFEVEGHREKGQNAAGYHNIYHKDEYKKDADFYDNDHQGGRFHKHGHYDEKHVSTEGDFRKGTSNNSSLTQAAAAKKGNFEKGRNSEKSNGQAAKSGYDGFFSKFDEFAKNVADAAGEKFVQNNGGTKS